MMRYLLVFTCLFLSVLTLSGQASSSFPQGWTGKWAGDLTIYKYGSDRETLPMSLTIQPIDDSGNYTWNIQYGSDSSDIRAYTIIPVDLDKQHFAIDEHNGIVLDGFFHVDTYFNQFSVDDTFLSFRIQKVGEKLIYEITSGPKGVLAVTQDESDPPFVVNSYEIPTMQRATLTRQ